MCTIEVKSVRGIMCGKMCGTHYLNKLYLTFNSFILKFINCQLITQRNILVCTSDILSRLIFLKLFPYIKITFFPISSSSLNVNDKKRLLTFEVDTHNEFGLKKTKVSSCVTL